MTENKEGPYDPKFGESPQFFDDETQKPMKIRKTPFERNWTPEKKVRWEKEFLYNIVRRLERHWELHRKPLTPFLINKIYGSTCARMGMRISTYIDAHPEQFFICQNIDCKVYIFAKTIWDELSKEEQFKWLNAEF